MMHSIRYRPLMTRLELIVMCLYWPITLYWGFGKIKAIHIYNATLGKKTQVAPEPVVAEIAPEPVVAQELGDKQNEKGDVPPAVTADPVVEIDQKEEQKDGGN